MCNFNYSPTASHKSPNGFHYPRNMIRTKIVDASFWNKKASFTFKFNFYWYNYCSIQFLTSMIQGIPSRNSMKQKNAVNRTLLFFSRCGNSSTNALVMVSNIPNYKIERQWQYKERNWVESENNWLMRKNSG